MIQVTKSNLKITPLSKSLWEIFGLWHQIKRQRMDWFFFLFNFWEKSIENKISWNFMPFKSVPSLLTSVDRMIPLKNSLIIWLKNLCFLWIKSLKNLLLKIKNMEISLKNIRPFTNFYNKFMRLISFQFTPNKEKYHSFYGSRSSQNIHMYSIIHVLIF